MKKILFHLNTLGRGGAERVVSTLANTLAARGYEVVVATEWTEKEEFALDPRVKRVHVGLTDPDRLRGRIGKYLARISYLRDCIRRERPDVVIAFARLALFRALMVYPFTKVPTVISVRIDPEKSYRGLRNALQIRLLLPMARGAVFQTKDAAAFFKGHLRCRPEIILNPLADKYLNVPVPGERTKRVVNAARLADFKNHPLLVEAFAIVHEKHPDYVLEIYGPDAGEGMKKKTEKTAKRLGIEDAVRLMGASDSLEEVLPDAAVFVSSSDYEGMPNAVMEAMAMGLPVVSTDCPCGGPRTLITDGASGLLTPVGDKEAMAKAICRLIEDKAFAEKLGGEARKLAVKADPGAVCDAWEAYLKEVLKESSGH